MILLTQRHDQIYRSSNGTQKKGGPHVYLQYSTLHIHSYSTYGDRRETHDPSLPAHHPILASHLEGQSGGFNRHPTERGS